MAVTLYTADGKPVTRVSMPSFVTPPKVIIWGDRVFTAGRAGDYTECFAYCVPDRERGSVA